MNYGAQLLSKLAARRRGHENEAYAGEEGTQDLEFEDDHDPGAYLRPVHHPVLQD